MKMRLIDADKLMLYMNDYALQESPNDTESTGERRISKLIYNAIKQCIYAVNEQPTAYDADKVVEHMGNKIANFDCKYCKYREANSQGCDKDCGDALIDELLDIVKGGLTE